MSAIKIQDGKLQLYSCVIGETCERRQVFAVLPAAVAKDWEGETLQVIDWRIDPATNTVKLTYQTRNDAYAPIYDSEFTVTSTTTPLPKPGRSKNWVWRQWSNAWQNTKTGERVPVLG